MSQKCNFCRTQTEILTRPINYSGESVSLMAASIRMTPGEVRYCPNCGNIQIELHNKKHSRLYLLIKRFVGKIHEYEAEIKKISFERNRQ